MSSHGPGTRCDDGSPTFSIDEVIAQRGDRLTLVELSVTYDDGFVIPYALLYQFDPAVERLERLVLFDPEQRDEASAHLDVLAAGID